MFQDYRASQLSLGHGRYEFRLFISKVQSRDFHDYQLIVTNDVDSVAVDFTLIEGKTSCPLSTGLQAVQKNGNTVLFCDNFRKCRYTDFSHFLPLQQEIYSA